MASAWQILTGNSTIPTGTAWQHLNNQGGGGGLSIFVGVPLDANAELDLSANAGDVLSSNILTPQLDANISDDGAAADTELSVDAEI